MLIEEANPPSEIRKVVVPFVHQDNQVGQTATLLLNLPLVLVAQERSMVERDEIEAAAAVVERTEIDKTLTLVIEPQAIYVSATEAAHISTRMPNLASATTSQEILATPTTTKTLLLLTFGLKFDRTAT